MDLPAHVRERIAELRALHRANCRLRGPGWWGWLFRIDGCTLCGEPYPCRQRQWTDDVESGAVPWRGARV